MSFPKRVLSALNYNEQKVARGVAECIGARGYLRETGDLTFYHKLQGFQLRNELNERAVTKTLHVSLNFDPSERLSDEKLLHIASAYMERIGFGAQPYLVYRHDDSGHPHLHIVTTTIREDGRRIPTHNLGRNGSQKARRELEVLFGLIPAEGRGKAPGALLTTERPDAVRYGQVETRKSMARVIHWVCQHYSFSSLPEFNAALRSFQVQADRGKEKGCIYRHGGLVYHVLDERGERVGVPIKASALPGKPVLKTLQARFAAGAQKKEPHKAVLKEKLDRCVAVAPRGLEGLIEHLEKRGVYTLLRTNGKGRLYGITFVDHQTGCVCNGSDLGKGYSAAGLRRRLCAMAAEGGAVEQRLKALAVPPLPTAAGATEEPRWPGKITQIDLLLSSGPPPEEAPASLFPQKRRKRKRPQHP